jgi:Zn-finger nucleic acid-binding protein
MICPRCDAPLDATELHDVAVATCAECAGTLVAVSRMIPLLSAMAAPLLGVISPDEPLEPAPPDDRPTACPHCQRAMTPFRYIETRIVSADRCDACRVVWMDPHELGVMALLYARTDRRLRDNAEMREAVQLAAMRADLARTLQRQNTDAVLYGAAFGGPMGMVAGVVASMVRDRRRWPLIEWPRRSACALGRSSCAGRGSGSPARRPRSG